MIKYFLISNLFLVFTVHLLGLDQRRIGRLETVSWENYFALGRNQLPFGSGSEYPDLSVVGALVSSSNELGTATLIAPNMVVTAAHVIQNSFYDDPDPDDWIFFLGDDLSDHSSSSGWSSEDSYEVSQFLVHEGWLRRQSAEHPLGDGDSLGVDIALVILKKSVLGLFPARIPNRNDDPLGKKAILAGYGTLITGNGSQEDSSNRKRVGAENTIDRSVPNVSVGGVDAISLGGLLAIDFDAPTRTFNSLGDNNLIDNLGVGTSSSSPLELEGSTARGDSGGPAFVFTENAWRIHGVVSYGTKDSTYGDVTVYTRLASHYDWIYENLPAWPSSKEIGELDWLENPWLGPLRPFPNKWNFFTRYGWMYIPFPKGEFFWAWNHLMNDWVWFSFSTIPFVYSQKEGNWIYILAERSNANGIRAYSYSKKLWLSF